jgi:5-methylcytosine-specific restriction endonuclease McrA
MGEHYICSKCKGSFRSADVQVDHIQPVVGPEGFTTWDAYIDQLFCDESNLQVLCLDCHKSKTLIEKGERDKNRSS